MTLTVENVLQLINQKYVKLDDSKEAHNKGLLKETLEDMISLMKEDDLFKTLFQEPFYGGSTYDGLKIEEPDEFDMDLLLVLPKKCKTHNSADCKCLEVIPSNKPGFFWFKLKETFYSRLNKFIKDDYVQTDLVISWLQSLVTKALNKLKQDENIHYYFKASFKSQSGPALVLNIEGKFGKINVDLVPAFKFGSKYWPKQGYRSNSTSKEDFCIVPKKANLPKYGERFWRASFQQQERELIIGKGKLKPALRLLKKMRNNLEHKSIFSYALKTIVLWNLEIWGGNQKTLTEVFLALLKEYRDYLNRKVLPYFWNKKYNLFEEIKRETLEIHGNEISKKIDLFERNRDTQPLEIAKIILKSGSEEYERFIEDYTNKNDQLSRNPTVLQTQELPVLQDDFDERERGIVQEDQTSAGDTVVVCTAALAIAAVMGITAWRALTPRNNNR